MASFFTSLDLCDALIDLPGGGFAHPHHCECLAAQGQQIGQPDAVTGGGQACHAALDLHRRLFEASGAQPCHTAGDLAHDLKEERHTEAATDCPRLVGAPFQFIGESKEFEHLGAQREREGEIERVAAPTGMFIARIAACDGLIRIPQHPEILTAIDPLAGKWIGIGLLHHMPVLLRIIHGLEQITMMPRERELAFPVV